MLQRSGPRSGPRCGSQQSTTRFVCQLTEAPLTTSSARMRQFTGPGLAGRDSKVEAIVVDVGQVSSLCAISHMSSYNEVSQGSPCRLMCANCQWHVPALCWSRSLVQPDCTVCPGLQITPASATLLPESIIDNCQILVVYKRWWTCCSYNQRIAREWPEAQLTALRRTSSRRPRLLEAF